MLPGAAPPEHQTAKAKLARQHGQRAGMPEGIRRVECRERAAELRCVAPAKEQVPDQRLSRGDELVGEDVPWTNLQLAALGHPGDARSGSWPDCQVVAQEYGLAVQQKGHGGGDGKLIQCLVQHGHEPRQETGAGLVPLAVPMGVRQQVKNEWSHARNGPDLRQRVFTIGWEPSRVRVPNMACGPRGFRLPGKSR